MELGYVVAALLAALWARSAWRARRSARELAVRRAEFTERGDWYVEDWTFDFAEMLAVHRHLITDWPSSEGTVLYELHRLDGPTWEVRLHPECKPHRLKEFEEFAKKSFEGAEALAEMRANIVAPQWQPVGEHRSAELETRYQVFLRHHDPTVEIREVGLETYWHRMVQNEERRRSREQERAAKP
jgi:hypothetical protein